MSESFSVWRGDIPADRFMIVTNDFMRGKLPVPLRSLARCLLGHLLSLPEVWEMYRCTLDESVLEGRDAVDRALRELVSAGYLQQIKMRAEGGKWKWAWRVTDDPTTRPLPPVPGNQGVDPTSENDTNPQVEPCPGNPVTETQGIKEDGLKKTDKKTDGEAGASRGGDQRPLLQASPEPAPAAKKKTAKTRNITEVAYQVWKENWAITQEQAPIPAAAEGIQDQIKSIADRFDCDGEALLSAAHSAGQRGRYSVASFYNPAPLTGARLNQAAQKIAAVVYEERNHQFNFMAVRQVVKSALADAHHQPEDVLCGLRALFTTGRPPTRQVLDQFVRIAHTNRLAEQAGHGKVER
jgi:hypothetical protein